MTQSSGVKSFAKHLAWSLSCMTGLALSHGCQVPLSVPALVIEADGKRYAELSGDPKAGGYLMINDSNERPRVMVFGGFDAQSMGLSAEAMGGMPSMPMIGVLDSNGQPSLVICESGSGFLWFATKKSGDALHPKFTALYLTALPEKDALQLFACDIELGPFGQPTASMTAVARVELNRLDNPIAYTFRAPTAAARRAPLDPKSQELQDQVQSILNATESFRSRAGGQNR